MRFFTSFRTTNVALSSLRRSPLKGESKQGSNPADARESHFRSQRSFQGGKMLAQLWDGLRRWLSPAAVRSPLWAAHRRYVRLLGRFSAPVESECSGR